MSSVLTCDHCHQPIGDRNDSVGVDVVQHATFTALLKRGGKRPGDMPAPKYLHYDLHPDCYDATVGRAIDGIGQQ